MNELEKSSVFGVNNNTDLLTDADRRLLNLRNRILMVAMAPNLKIDESKHAQSDNLALKKFTEHCGYSFRDFVIQYLENLQPFMIHEEKDRSNQSSKFSCIIDPAYKIPLWVEFYYTQFSECIISFHEFNWYNKRYEHYYLDRDNAD